MKRIRLFCAQGMSTSLLVSKMKESAQKQGLDVDIAAYPVKAIDIEIGNTDVALLGPQVGYMLNKVKPMFDEHNIPVAVIDMKDYGRMNGERVLASALNLLK